MSILAEAAKNAVEQETNGGSILSQAAKGATAGTRLEDAPAINQLPMPTTADLPDYGTKNPLETIIGVGKAAWSMLPLTDDQEINPDVGFEKFIAHYGGNAGFINAEPKDKMNMLIQQSGDILGPEKQFVPVERPIPEDEQGVFGAEVEYGVMDPATGNVVSMNKPGFDLQDVSDVEKAVTSEVLVAGAANLIPAVRAASLGWRIAGSALGFAGLDATQQLMRQAEGSGEQFSIPEAATAGAFAGGANWIANKGFYSLGNFLNIGDYLDTAWTKNVSPVIDNSIMKMEDMWYNVWGVPKNVKEVSDMSRFVNKDGKVKPMQYLTDDERLRALATLNRVPEQVYSLSALNRARKRIRDAEAQWKDKKGKVPDDKKLPTPRLVGVTGPEFRSAQSKAFASDERMSRGTYGDTSEMAPLEAERMPLAEQEGKIPLTPAEIYYDPSKGTTRAHQDTETRQRIDDEAIIDERQRKMNEKTDETDLSAFRENRDSFMNKEVSKKIFEKYRVDSQANFTEEIVEINKGIDTVRKALKNKEISPAEANAMIKDFEIKKAGLIALRDDTRLLNEETADRVRGTVAQRIADTADTYEATYDLLNKMADRRGDKFKLDEDKVDEIMPKLPLNEFGFRGHEKILAGLKEELGPRVIKNPDGEVLETFPLGLKRIRAGKQYLETERARLEKAGRDLDVQEMDVLIKKYDENVEAFVGKYMDAETIGSPLIEQSNRRTEDLIGKAETERDIAVEDTANELFDTFKDAPASVVRDRSGTKLGTPDVDTQEVVRGEKLGAYDAIDDILGRSRPDSRAVRTIKDVMMDTYEKNINLENPYEMYNNIVQDLEKAVDSVDVPESVRDELRGVIKDIKGISVKDLVNDLKNANSIGKVGTQPSESTTPAIALSRKIDNIYNRFYNKLEGIADNVKNIKNDPVIRKIESDVKQIGKDAGNMKRFETATATANSFKKTVSSLISDNPKLNKVVKLIREGQMTNEQVANLLFYSDGSPNMGKELVDAVAKMPEVKAKVQDYMLLKTLVDTDTGLMHAGPELAKRWKVLKENPAARKLISEKVLKRIGEHIGPYMKTGASDLATIKGKTNLSQFHADLRTMSGKGPEITTRWLAFFLDRGILNPTKKSKANRDAKNIPIAAFNMWSDIPLYTNYRNPIERVGTTAAHSEAAEAVGESDEPTKADEFVQRYLGSTNAE